MSVIRLQSLAVRFVMEADMVLQRFTHVFPNGHERCAEPYPWCQEMCVVRLLDAWARFCRDLVLISASQQPLTSSGTRLPLAPGIKRRKDALRVLRAVYTRFPWEPRWIDAQACLSAANLLKIANYSTLSAGLAVTPSPVEDLRKLRNFLAHKNEGTAAEVRTTAVNIGVGNSSDVIGILQSDPTGSGANTIQSWIQQLQAMSEIAAR